MGIFDSTQAGTYRIDGGASRDLLIWAVLFDFWMYVLSGAGAALSIIGFASSASLTTATAAVNAVPVIGQIVSAIVSGIGLASGSAFLLIGLGISTAAALVGVSLSMTINGLFKQRGVNVFARSIVWRVITVIVTKIIPGFGALPLFTIFTATSIGHARKEDRKRAENASAEANVFAGESV